MPRNFLQAILFCQIFFCSNVLARALEIPDITTYADIETSTKSGRVIILTRKQIVASGATTLAELLHNQPAVQLLNTSGDYSQATISLRGFGDNAAANSLVLIDGYRLANFNLMPPDLNAISLSNIERIEIIPGSAGTLYGNQAVGGVIKITTRKPQRFAAELLTGYGNYQHGLVSGLVGDKFLNGLGYQVSGLINHTDNFREHNTQDNNAFNARLIYDTNHGSSFIKLQHTTNKILYPGPLTAQQVKADPRQASITTNFANNQTTQIQTGIQQFLNADWTLDLPVAYTGIQGSGFVFVPFNQRQQITLLNPKLVGSLGQATITTGVDLEQDSYRFFSSKVNSKVLAQQVSPYLQAVIPLNDRLDLTLGGRAALQTNNVAVIIGQGQGFKNTAIVAEQGLRLRLYPDWQIYLRRDGNYRFPKADEDIWLPSGISHLQTQKGASYELGAEWQQLDRSLKISLYQLRLNNEIAFDPTQTVTQPFGANNNLPATIRNGIGINGVYPLTKKLNLQASYDFVNPQFAIGPLKNKQIPGVSRTIANIRCDYLFATHWKVSVEEFYLGSRYASQDTTNVGDRLGGYSLTNIGINYQVKQWNLELRVNNLFNKMYNLYTVYNAPSQQTSFYPAAGRNYLVTLKLQFA